MWYCSAITPRRLHFVYIVRCADGTLYTGYARDPAARTAVHNAGRGARYTLPRRPVTLVFAQGFRSKTQALRQEYRLKRLSRADKLRLVGSSRTADPPIPGTVECQTNRGRRHA